MTRTKWYLSILAALGLVAALVVLGSGQGTNVRQVKNLPNADYNVSGTIGWKTGTGWVNVEKNCSDLRVVVNEKTGTKTTPAGPIDELKAVGYVYPTAIANSTDCSYQTKLVENKPWYLTVERMSAGGLLNYPQGWQNPVVVRPGQKLVRNFKMGTPMIH